MVAKQTKRVINKPKEVSVRYVVPEDNILLFSDGVILQHTDNEFIISFFQSGAPIFLTDADRDKITEVNSKCVARIVLSPAQMKKTVDAFKVNFESWASKIETAEKAEVIARKK